MKVIFAGTPEFAAVALHALHAAGFTIPLVLTQPDRPAGRGMHLQASAVKQFAVSHSMPVAQPVSLRLDGKHADAARQAHELLRQTPHDVMVVAAYGLILPLSVLSLPRLGCLNIHASLLPRWRGAAPIHRAIEAGDTQTGITIMQMDQGLDTGPMLTRTLVPISEEDTTGSLHDRLAALGGDMIGDALMRLQRGELTAEPQPEEGVTYASKISKEEATLDFSADALTLVRKIRAFNPFPGAVGVVDGVPLKIWDAHSVASSIAAAPGSVLHSNSEHGVLVACGQGALQLKIVQKPGGKRMVAEDFIKGFELQGKRFSSTP